MQIAWYNPELDKIVVQDVGHYSEKLITFDLPPVDENLSPFVDAFAEAARRQNEYFLKKLEWEMYYGQGFHWLEQGLWVRLGEV